jgi:simple sugar transport system permease protein
VTRLRAAAAALLVPLAALAIALALGAVAILAAGASPLEVYRALFAAALLTPYGIGQTLARATPLLFTGLSVTLAARAGLFNIGGEGQMIAGGFAMALVGASLPDAPAAVLLPLALGAGALGGALWAAPAAALRARFGASEVIATILMNWIGVHVFGWLLRLHVAAHAELAETSRTLEVAPGARLALLGSFVPALRGSQASLALPLGLAAAAACAFFLARSRRGFELRAVGLGADAARAAGIDVARVEAATLLLAGALAGLGASGSVLAVKRYYEEGFTAGAGFAGIAVAFLGRTRPGGVVLAALLLGALAHGGFAVGSLVPKEIVAVLEALVIVAVAAAGEVAERARARRLARSAGS